MERSPTIIFTKEKHKNDHEEDSHDHFHQKKIEKGLWIDLPRSFSIKKNTKMIMERSPTIIFTKEKHKNDHEEDSHDHFHQKKIEKGLWIDLPRSFSIKKNTKMIMERSPTIIFTKEKHKNDHEEDSHDHFHQKKIEKGLWIDLPRSFSIKKNTKMIMERSPTIIFTKEKHKNDHEEDSHDHFHQKKIEKGLWIDLPRSFSIKKNTKMIMERSPTIIFTKEKHKNDYEEDSHDHFHQRKIQK